MKKARLCGILDKTKSKGNQIMKKLLKWLDNYWYHYKWPTVITAALAIIIVIMAAQFVGRDKFDLSILYAGPLDITPNQTRDVENETAKLLAEDLNGDGKKNCQLASFYLLTEEQISAVQAEYDEREELYFVNRSELASTRQKFTNQISAGDASVMLLDPYWYETLKKQDLIVPLNEILDSVPDYAQDEYSVRFADTPFAKFFTATQVFPDDTVLCLRRMPITSAFTGKSSAEKQYGCSKELFRAFVGFSVEN